MAKVAPSILAANFNELLAEVKSVSSAEFLHIDVMDGHFVPNISMGPVIYAGLSGKVNMVFDVHLMISEPLKYAASFVKAGADYLTFHYEAVEDVKAAITYIKSLHAKVGISIKPNTNVEVLKPYLEDLDLILIMSVEPGFGGQKFMMNAIDKIKYLKKEKDLNKFNYLIEVDGGINLETATLCVNAGCEVLVAGTYIFNSINREETIQGLQKL